MQIIHNRMNIGHVASISVAKRITVIGDFSTPFRSTGPDTEKKIIHLEDILITLDRNANFFTYDSSNLCQKLYLFYNYDKLNSI